MPQEGLQFLNKEVRQMCWGNWQGVWGYPSYFGSLISVLFHLSILVLLVWIVVAGVKSITQKLESSQKGGAR
jgi:hypothetical protein